MSLIRLLLAQIRTAIPPRHRWVVDLFGDLIVLVPRLVRRLNKERFAKLSGEEKAAAVVVEVRKVLDAADDLPGWREVPEHRRDKIIGGLSELALYVIEVVEEDRHLPSPVEVDSQRRVRADPGRRLSVERGVDSALKRLEHRFNR